MQGRTIKTLVLALSLLSATVQASGGQTPAQIDLGWLQVSQTDGIWRVVRVSDPSPSKYKIRESDTIVAVDNFSLANLNALTVARILNRISLDATTVTVVRMGSTERLQLHVSTETLTAQALMTEANTNRVVLYGKDDRFPNVSLPDAFGQMHGILFEGKWTLIHIWNTECDPSEVAALNEITRPSPEKLSVVGIAMNDAPETVKQFAATREKIEFLNLLGGDYAGDFARRINYFALRTDIVVSPEGQVVFVGNGPSALKEAWIAFRAHADKESTGAEEGTRTPTPLRVHGPEPCASANSATSAKVTG
jgi:hypothetical protein